LILVNFSVVSGGAALVAASALAASSFSPGMGLLFGNGCSYMIYNSLITYIQNIDQIMMQGLELLPLQLLGVTWWPRECAWVI